MAISDRIHSLSKVVSDELKLRPLNIIEFAESEAGFNLKLFPAQKFVFKLFYKIPLSNNPLENLIIIRDQFNEVVLYEFTEKEFYAFLYAEKRINMTEAELYSSNLSLEEIQFFIGRRGTKTSMTSIITGYTMYLMLLIHNPHEYFDILTSDEIGVAITSNNSANASRQSRSLVTMISRSKFFKKYLAGDIGGSFYLKSDSFLEEEQRGMTYTHGNLVINTFAATPSVRGASNVVVVMDEFAHFLDSNTRKEKRLDEALYEALTPSTSGFVTPDGISYGKSFIMTSPNGKSGKSYDFYKESFTTDSYLMLNLPSNWVNTKISPTRLRNAFNKSEASFRQEYQAEFLDSENLWITQPDRLRACVNLLQLNRAGHKMSRANTYFMGIDFGLSNDGTAIAICHYESVRPEHLCIEDNYRVLLSDKGCYIFDYIEYIAPDEEQEVLDIDYVMSRVKYIHSLYRVHSGHYDQWSEALITQQMKKHGLAKSVTTLNATERVNSELAGIFKQQLMEGKLMLPHDEDVVDELMALKEEPRRNGMSKVENKNSHDDRFTAMLRALYLCYTSIGNGTVSVTNNRALHKQTNSGIQVSSAVNISQAPGLRFSKNVATLAMNKRDYSRGRA